MFYNFDYGFITITDTRSGDGDHLDALLIIDEPTFTGCHVWARPIGGLEMRDEKGVDGPCASLSGTRTIERLDQAVRTDLLEVLDALLVRIAESDAQDLEVERPARHAS